MILTENIVLKGSHLYVTPDFVCEYGVTYDFVKKSMNYYRTGKISKWANNPNNKLGRKRLIDFDSIDFRNLKPFKQPNAPAIPIKSQLLEYLKEEEREKRASQNDLLALSVENSWEKFYNPSDKKYYQDKYNVNSGRANGRDRAKDLATCMAILRMLNEYSTIQKIKHHTGFSRKGDLLDAVFNYIKSNDLYGLATSYRNFNPKFNEYKEALKDKSKDERDVLVHGNQGNRIGVKFDHYHKIIFLEIYLDPKKPDILECWYNYKENMKVQFGLAEESCISYSRFKQICQEKEIKVLAAKCRDGGPYYEVFIRPFIIGKPPRNSMSLVAGDGWVPGRRVKYNKVTYDEKGREIVTPKIGVMNVWIWYDWKSSAILSHSTTPNEHSEAIRKSFRNIMGLHGKCPRSVMVDKKWMKQKETKEMFELAGVYLQPKRGYNPKSNIAERNNKEANKHHRNLDDFWVDVTNNTVGFKHNEEWVRKAKPMEEADFRAMVYKIIERHNHSPRPSLKGKTPWEVYEENISSECKEFDPLELTYIFGATSKPTTVRNYSVKFQVASKKHHYIIPKQDMIAYNSRNVRKDKVIVYYDELHMDTVDIYEFDPNDPENKSKHIYICTCTNADDIAINRATVEEELDHKFSDQQERGTELDNWITETLAQHESDMESLDIDPISVQQVSQDRYKEIHENRISKVYRDFHQEREMEAGIKIRGDKEVVTNDVDESKLKKLEEALKEFENE